jgi:hypothetical protein
MKIIDFIIAVLLLALGVESIIKQYGGPCLARQILTAQCATMATISRNYWASTVP